MYLCYYWLNNELIATRRESGMLPIGYEVDIPMRQPSRLLVDRGIMHLDAQETSMDIPVDILLRDAYSFEAMVEQLVRAPWVPKPEDT